MFGKKKKDADAGADSTAKVESVAPAKSKGSKVKKQSLKGGPNIFVAHVEKIGLGLLAAVACFLAYGSFSAPGLEASKSDPKKLENQARELLNKVQNENHWDAIKEERLKFAEKPDKFRNDVVKTREPVNSSNYRLGQLEPPKQKDILEKRRDPKILPAQDLVVKSVSAAIAIAVADPKENPDQFNSLEDAEPYTKGNKKKKEEDNQNQLGSDATGTNTAQKPKRRLKASYDLGAQFVVPGMGGLGMEGGGDSMGGGLGSGAGGGRGGAGGGGSGLGSGGMGGGEGMAGGGGAAGGGAGLGDGPKGPTHRLGTTPVFFNAITALIPHRKNFEEYYNTFLNTGTFVQARDLPQYLGIEVQRVEVSASDPYREIKEAEWKTILTNREVAEMPLDMFKEKNLKNPKNAWASHYPRKRGETRLGSPVPEIIDPRAVLKGLTAPIPPVLIRDYREFAKHPAIDYYWNAKVKRIRPKADDKDPGSEDGDVVFDSSSGGGAPGMGGEGMGGGSGMGGGRGGGGFGGDEGGYSGGDDYGMGDPGLGGEDYGMGGEGGMMGGVGGGRGGGSMGGGSMGGGSMGGGSMGGGMEGGMGGSSMLANLNPELQPEFKMVRMYDFFNLSKEAPVGKTYRYRMRIIMRDPNYPENQDYNPMAFKEQPVPMQLPAPENRELDHEVYVRVSKLRETDDKAIEDAKKKTSYKARTMRFTDWSEPSPPVTVAPANSAFVGDVFPGPSAKLAISQMSGNPKFPGATLAAEVTAERGAVLGVEASKTPLEIIAPTSKLIKKVEGQSVMPRQVVVDIRGGLPLQGGSKDDPLVTNGEVLIMRADGSMIITNKQDDEFLYRMYTFQDEKEKKNTNEAQGSGGMMGGEGGGPGGGGR